jgi:hypothetical protein
MERKNVNNIQPSEAGQQAQSAASILAARRAIILSQIESIDQSPIAPTVEPVQAHMAEVPVRSTRRANPIEVNKEAVGNYDLTIHYLDVERNPRYLPRDGKTFCNIYAHDFARMFGVFLPRIWWTASAQKQILSGKTPTVQYGQNVTELNANALYEWLKSCKDRPELLRFGWREVTRVEANDLVNKGTHFAVICARRIPRSRSGHITVIIPGSQQSEAGLTNRRRFDSEWYKRPERYDAWGCFVTPVPVT